MEAAPREALGVGMPAGIAFWYARTKGLAAIRPTNSMAGPIRPRLRRTPPMAVFSRGRSGGQKRAAGCPPKTQARRDDGLAVPIAPVRQSESFP